MSLINDKNMNVLVKWASENGDKNIYPCMSKEKDSYYICRDSEENYIMEYAVESILELRKYMEKYSGIAEDSQILKFLIIKICQDRYRSKQSLFEETGVEKNRSGKEKSVLPEFRYAD